VASGKCKIQDFVHKRGFNRHKKKIFFLFVFYCVFLCFFCVFLFFLFFFVFCCFCLFFVVFFVFLFFILKPWQIQPLEIVPLFGLGE